MKKLASTFPNMILSLGIICIVSGAALAWVDSLTSEALSLSKQMKLEAALSKVIADYDNNPVEEAAFYPTLTGDSLRIYPATKEGELTSVAVESYSTKGFSGNIRVLAGFDANGILLNYSVLEQAETPGLGSKMEKWFRSDKNKQSVLGKNLSKGKLKVNKDGGEIDAITAATISSRAFLDAINHAYEAFAAMHKLEIDTSTSATETDAVYEATTKSDIKKPAASPTGQKAEIASTTDGITEATTTTPTTETDGTTEATTQEETESTTINESDNETK